MTIRVSPLARDDIAPEVVAQLRSSLPRVGKFFGEPGVPPMPPVLGLLARHPALAGPWLGFSGALLDGGVLEDRTREFVILATAHRTGAEYVWREHVPLARAAGITDAEIEAIQASRSHRLAAVEVALLRAVDELVGAQRVTDRTWAELAGRYDDQALLEVLFLIGAYSCLAMVLNSAGLVDERKESP